MMVARVVTKTRPANVTSLSVQQGISHFFLAFVILDRFGLALERKFF